MIPNLIHPIPVRIQRRNVAATVFDARAREPVRQLWKSGQGPGTGDAVDLVAQVNWNQKDGVANPTVRPGGVEEKSEGYLLFRLVDLLAAGIATENGDGTVEFGLDRGDRIVRIGRRRTNLFVVFFRDVAGYEDQGGCTLLEVDFSSRQPSSPAREG
jgi:hypothetical protein